jgi:hypothetical protein
MVNNALWFVPNAVIPIVLQAPTVKEEIRPFQLTIWRSNKRAPKRLSCERYGSTRRKQASAKTFATRSAYQILSVIIVIIGFNIKRKYFQVPWLIAYLDYSGSLRFCLRQISLYFNVWFGSRAPKLDFINPDWLYYCFVDWEFFLYGEFRFTSK